MGARDFNPPSGSRQVTFLDPGCATSQNLSFGQSNHDTLVTLYVAHKADILKYVSCTYEPNSRSGSNEAHAIVTKVDYVNTCQMVLFILWCSVPVNTYKRDSLHLNFGSSEYASAELDNSPVKVFPQIADRRPRHLVVCMSRLIAFEKWQLLVTALEVYKFLKVDLVVAHVKSVLTPILELMKIYEEDGILALRTAGRLPSPPGMDFDPNAELEHSGQALYAHECMYEFRESAKFVALLDWDDLLITTKYRALWKAFDRAATKFPEASYFLINSLESTFIKRKKNPSEFDLQEQIQDGVLTQYVYSHEKMIGTGNGIGDIRYLSHLNLSQWLASSSFQERMGLIKTFHSLPQEKVYESAMEKCDRYIKAMPIIALFEGCTSRERCAFPLSKVPCAIAKDQYQIQIVKGPNPYGIHTRFRSDFQDTPEGCFQ
ncbi:glycosyltransferase family 92 domain-containing protein [Ditylenchus destructor]|uniref:Glycosyltransferase family 92 protein n=1 Tax=Ditylenchus destructor TaxID=166010 RepID=A0AAD4MTH1_9BILA|nr:glycosyltransferase family 92 domain-containing protein [Ditylenchus destructor]